jgi:hypothetical protein
LLIPIVVVVAAAAMLISLIIVVAPETYGYLAVPAVSIIIVRSALLTLVSMRVVIFG